MKIQAFPTESVGLHCDAGSDCGFMRHIGYTHGVALVLIALGSNVGDSLSHLQEATHRLSESFECLSASSVYETDPMYVLDQRSFLNAAVLARTHTSPLAALATLKRMEREIGRQRRDVNGPREIDLDLIAYGNLSYRYFDGDRLVLHVPHPRVAERRFVLQPLADIAADFRLSGIGRVYDLLVQTESQATNVRKVEHAVLSVQRSE